MSDGFRGYLMILVWLDEQVWSSAEGKQSARLACTEVPHWETWRQKNNVTAQKTNQNTRVPGSVCVEGLIFRHLFCSWSAEEFGLVHSVFQKNNFLLNAEFVDRMKSMESVCLLQDNILLLTSRGEEVARVRYQEVNYSHTARAHIHTHIIYIYI